MTTTIQVENVPGRKNGVGDPGTSNIPRGMIFTGGGDYTFLNCTKNPVYIVNSSNAVINIFNPSGLEVIVTECLEGQTGILGFVEATTTEDWRMADLRKDNPKLYYIVTREIAFLARDHLYCYPYGASRRGINGQPAYYGLAVLGQR